MEATEAMLVAGLKETEPLGELVDWREGFGRAEMAAAFKAMMAAAWQPIETAPKGGRELILLLTPSRFPQVAYSNTWWTAGCSVENKPTHWMPLPAPPSNTN